MSPPKKKKIAIFSNGYGQCMNFFKEQETAIAAVRNKISAVAQEVADDPTDEWQDFDF